MNRAPISVVFLDMDGVLNSHSYLIGEERLGVGKWNPEDDIDSKAVSLLNAIVKEGDAKVVISSAWRYAHPWPTMQELLNKKGFIGEVIGETPALEDDLRREGEISAWLYDEANARSERSELRLLKDMHGIEVGAFVVLDDIDMTDFFGDRMVLTDDRHGLSEPHVMAAIEQLKTPFDGALRGRRSSRR